MAQVVEGEAFTGRLADALKGLCDRIWAHTPHTRPLMRLGSASRTASAAVESGTRLGVPFLFSGTSNTRALRHCGPDGPSRCSQRMAAISPRRMAVSMAQVMIGPT